MCYAIPGKVVAIADKKVTVEYFGEQKTAINEVKALKLGDYIYAQGGYVIEIVPEPEARSILDAWKETFFALQEVDVNLSRRTIDKAGVSPDIVRICDKALEERPLKREELIKLMELEQDNELQLLYKTANFLRQKILSNSCCVHGIIEFSNHCQQQCAYCGISGNRKNINRYRMTEDEILEATRIAVETYGFKALVLQSGEDTAFSADDLARIIRKIKDRFAVLLFISCGEVGIPGLQKIYDAGARGLLMRFETSNPTLYEKMRPGCRLQTRLDHLKAAYDMGYLVLTGGLIGLPGQTRDDLLNDILLTKELHAEMYSFGPFIPPIPHPHSSPRLPTSSNFEVVGVRNSGIGDREWGVQIIDVLKTLALCRIHDPHSAKILVTTGFETLHPAAREEGLMAGANSVMLNVTPYTYKKDYTIYPNRAHIEEELQQQIETTLALLKKLGRAPTDLGI